MTAARPLDLSDRVTAVLNDLRAEWGRRYAGGDLSTLRSEPHEEGVRVVGRVLTRKQLDALRGQLEPLAKGESDSSIALDVSVIEDEFRGDDLYLCHPGARAPLWVAPRVGSLATEWLPEDGPARLLASTRAHRLLQLSDATLGWWVDAPSPLVAAPIRLPFLVVMAPGERIPCDEVERVALIEAARLAAERAIPYRLGGRDWVAGLDCSAFVQLLIRQHTQKTLPRHTGDQIHMGQRVPRSRLSAGDLVFARAQGQNILHVGLALGSTEIAHACRVDKKVIIESLDSVCFRYRFLGVRRVLCSVS